MTHKIGELLIFSVTETSKSSAAGLSDVGLDHSLAPMSSCICCTDQKIMNFFFSSLPFVVVSEQSVSRLVSFWQRDGCLMGQ